MVADQRLYDLVVVGSSAGGIEALSLLVSTLPADFSASIVLAQHLGSDYPSHLAEILARHSVLPVHVVNEGAPEPLAAGTIYVVPADRDVEITDHAVVLHARANGLPKPSVDLLLASAAGAYGARVIAVILTGTGSDGAAGALAVKAAGGAVVIENPDTASYPSMPASLAPSSVDRRVDLARIGPLLHDLVTGAYTLAATGDILSLLLEEARTYSGIDFSLYKRPTILRRIHKRMTATGAETLHAYHAYAQLHPEEYTRLSASFLIKVTEFFRDQALFDYLSHEVAPAIIAGARKDGARIRIWSAGCATGEEAYSLAILFAERLGAELDRFTVQIFATDADADAIAFARRGVYSAAALATIPQDLRDRYFEPVDGEWAISKRVRGMVVFGEHDLGQRAPFPDVDLVMCRNVLIYFDPVLQKRALQLFAFSLREGRYLVLGTSETTSPLPDYFAAIQPHLKVFRRLGIRMQALPIRVNAPQPPPLARELSLLSPSSQLPVASQPAQRAAVERWQARSMHAALGEQFLDLSLGVVVVDSNYDVQAINSAAYTLLEISRVARGRDLLHLATRVPTKPFREVIDAAFRSASARERAPRTILTLSPGEPRILEVTCFPHRRKLQDGAVKGAVDAVIILITDMTDATATRGVQRLEDERAHVAQTPPRRRLQRNEASPRLDATAQADHVEQELAHALATLRDVNAANQELRDANQELRDDNEALRTREEEAQAAAEEVKTLNEELQATNEEFETLNEELEATLEELRATNDDLQARTEELEELATQRHAERQVSERARGRLAAILASMSDALLVIDAQGAIALTNEAYEMAFGSATSDTALRSLEDSEGQALSSEATLRSRAREGEPFTMEFGLRAQDGSLRWYEARGRPVRNEEGMSDGNVLEEVVSIRDITDSSRLRLHERFVAMVNHELRNPLTSLLTALELLTRRLPQDEGDSIHRLTALALRQASLLRSMVDDLSDLTRAQQSKLQLQAQPVDLVALLRQVVEGLNILDTLKSARGDDDSDQRIVLRILPDTSISLWIVGDPLRLEQIVNNLLTNALTYAPESRHLDVSLQRQEQWVELRVQDNGPGIADTALPHLFVPYYQATRRAPGGGKGLGLGLFIVAELVKAHGGTISVRSAEGKGTVFTVRFPLTAEPGGARERADYAIRLGLADGHSPARE